MANTSISAQIEAIGNALVADFGDEDGCLPDCMEREAEDIERARVAAQELEVADDEFMAAMASVLLQRAQRLADMGRGRFEFFLGNERKARARERAAYRQSDREYRA